MAVLKFSWINKQWAVWHCAVQIKSANLTASNSSQHVHLQYGKTALFLALKSKRYHNHVYRIFTIKNCKQGNFPLVYNGKKSNCQWMCIITPKIIVIFNIKQHTIVTNLHISVYTVILVVNLKRNTQTNMTVIRCSWKSNHIILLFN